MSNFLYWFVVFFIFSIIGWIAEFFYIGYTEKKFMNRGFLVGPYCPIYGVGSLGMIFYLSQYKDNFVTVFLLGVFICCILEYITSYVMELIFKIRWWDYSNELFNLNGRICGKNAILFGLGGIAVIYYVNPFIQSILSNIERNTLNKVSFVLLIIMIIDEIFSCNIINKLKSSISNIEVKHDSTEEISRMVRNKILGGHKFFQKRLYLAFPNVNFRNIVKIKKSLKDIIISKIKK